MNTDKLKITVSGMNLEASRLLSKIISDCLKRDYLFRTQFANWKILIDEKLEDLSDMPEKL